MMPRLFHLTEFAIRNTGHFNVVDQDVAEGPYVDCDEAHIFHVLVGERRYLDARDFNLDVLPPLFGCLKGLALVDCSEFANCGFFMRPDSRFPLVAREVDSRVAAPLELQAARIAIPKLKRNGFGLDLGAGVWRVLRAVPDLWHRL